MLRHYFKIAIKNILRNKLISSISIIGLSLSFACCILITFFIRYELSYDRFNHNADRIYRFTIGIQNKNGYHAHFARCDSHWIKYLPIEFPEIEKMVTLIPFKDISLKIGENKILLNTSFYADSTLFNVFSIHLLRGDSNLVLTKPNSIVISQSFAQKYFGNHNPVGQTIENTNWYDGRKWTGINYTVTGVFRDIPPNSHFHSDLFISQSSITWNTDDNWKYVYLLFYRNARPADFLKEFQAFLVRHKDQYSDSNSKDITPDLQLITDIHLKSDKDREIEANSSMIAVYVMGLVGFIILLISWINYFNLSIASLYNREKAINTFKLHGSPNSHIVFQYLIEALIIVFISFDIAYVMICILLPSIKIITGNVINEHMFYLAHEVCPWIITMFCGTLVVGSIPAMAFLMGRKQFFLNNSGLSGKLTQKPTSLFRRLLIIFQFVLTIVLIISALTIKSQNLYILTHQVGAKQDSVLVIKLFNQDILSRYTLFKSELLKSPLVNNATASFEDPYDLTMDAMGFETQGIKGENKDKILWVYSADSNFFKFYHVPLIAGTDFPPFNENLKKDFYILNESAVRYLGWTPEEAIGRPFKLKFSEKNIFYGGQIVGVVNDFALNTLQHKIKPYVFFQKKIWFWDLIVDIDMNHKQQAIRFIKKKWNEIYPDYPLNLRYNTNLFFNAYKKEIVQSRLTGFFSILAILISCLGLFAISSISILQRTKEIGIRKVNGARTLQIITQLIKDFMLWVAIAFGIACPIAYYLMHQWLANFTYKISLEWWIFALAGLVAIVVAIATVGWQSWRAANKNPVEALRYE